MAGELKAAFEEMKRTEMALDDMDYLTDSPKLRMAMAAAESFRELLEKAEMEAKAKNRTH